PARALAASIHQQVRVPGSGPGQALERLAPAASIADVLDHDGQIARGGGGPVVPGTDRGAVVPGEAHVPGVHETQSVVHALEGEQRCGGFAGAGERVLPEGVEVTG